MILLDTNVVSDSSRPRPHPSVRNWFSAQSPADLYICSPVLAELRYGVERLPMGNRRKYLEEWQKRIEQEGFSDRILSFDRRAAYEFGRLLHQRTSAGRPIRTIDAMIASIAKAEGATLATRDVGDFSDLGLEIVNPFEFNAV
jgi:predicted nucleic acid-binding protein